VFYFFRGRGRGSGLKTNVVQARLVDAVPAPESKINAAPVSLVDSEKFKNQYKKNCCVAPLMTRLRNTDKPPTFFLLGKVF
jgi:hypothetical protein